MNGNKFGDKLKNAMLAIYSQKLRKSQDSGKVLPPVDGVVVLSKVIHN